MKIKVPNVWVVKQMGCQKIAENNVIICSSKERAEYFRDLNQAISGREWEVEQEEIFE